MILRAAWIVLLFLLTTHIAPPALAQEPPARTYRLRAGDQIEIQVFRDPELTRIISVPPDGKVQYPVLGELSLIGLTPSELAQRITRALSAELGRPMVSVGLTKQKGDEVNVIGALARPGRVPLGESWKLLDLVAACGGITLARPEWARAQLVRARDGSTLPIDLEKLLKQGDASQNIALLPGDTLLVSEVEPSTLSVRVLGEVGKPGIVAAPTDASLTTLLALVGGLNPKAAASKARLVREGKVFSLDLSGLLTTGKPRVTDPDGRVSDTLSIKAGDTLLVPPARERFVVLGGVARPGAFELPDGERVGLLDAFASAGGLLPQADLKKVHLVRLGTFGTPEIVDLNVEEMLKGRGAALKTPLSPGDVLYIETKGQRQPFSWRDALSAAALLLTVVR